MCVCVCVCVHFGRVNAEHIFRVWVTILGCMSRHMITNGNHFRELRSLRSIQGRKKVWTSPQDNPWITIKLDGDTGHAHINTT